LLDFDFEHTDFDIFYSHLQHLVDKYTVVYKGDFQNPKDKPWFKEELLTSMKLRDKFYALKVKCVLNDYFQVEFKKYRPPIVG
jgi:hypothetical protein